MGGQAETRIDPETFRRGSPAGSNNDQTNNEQTNIKQTKDDRLLLLIEQIDDAIKRIDQIEHEIRWIIGSGRGDEKK